MKIFATPIFFVLATSFLPAQSPEVIKIDFKTKEICIPDNCSLKEVEFLQVKICNINLNLYNVSINTKDTTLSKPQQTPSFGLLPTDDLLKFIPAIGDFATVINEIESALGKAFGPQKESDLISSGIQLEADKMSSFKSEVVVNLADIDNFKLNIYSKRLKYYKLEHERPAFNYEEELEIAQNIRGSVFALVDKIAESENGYLKFFANNRDTIIKKYPELDKLIKEGYKALSTAVSAAAASISAEKTMELLESLVFLENNSNTTFTSLPFQFNGEQTLIRVSIQPKEERFKLQGYQTKLTIPAKIKPYTVVGMSFFASSLYDEAFTTVETQVNDTTSVFTFVDEENGSAEIGLAALLRYGTKINDSNNIGCHFSFGTGVSLSRKVKPRLMLGGGISFGKKHMVAVDAGLVIGFVDRLSNAIDLTKEYPQKPETLTVARLKAGGFLSLGYAYQF